MIRRALWAAPWVLTGTLLCLTIIGLPIGIIMIEIGMRPIIKHLKKKASREVAEHHRRVAEADGMAPPLTEEEIQHVRQLAGEPLDVERRARQLQIDMFGSPIEKTYVDWNNDLPPLPPKPWEEEED
jgi:predicted membrane protein